MAIIDKAAAEGDDFIPEVYRDSFHYDELIGKTFTYYPTDSIFEYYNNEAFGISGYQYLSDSKNIKEGAEKVELEVVGIISPKETVNYGCISSGIYYTEALTDYILESNRESDFISYLLDDANAPSLSATYYRIMYQFSRCCVW